MEVSASVSGEARGGTFSTGGCSSVGEGLFSAVSAMLGLASSGVCSLGMSGAVVFVVCGTGLLLLEDEGGEEDASDVSEAGKFSCISPLLSKTLGYVGPQRTSQQFLIIFLWLYGFWTLFFPDQDPLISSLVVWLREIR